MGKVFKGTVSEDKLPFEPSSNNGKKSILRFRVMQPMEQPRWTAIINGRGMRRKKVGDKPERTENGGKAEVQPCEI